MAVETGAFRFGGTNYPLTASTANSLLRDADPALYWAIEFWKSVLNTHLSARLVAEAVLCEAPITAAVKSTANYDPGPFLLEHAQLTPPVLAVYRVSDAYKERTVTWDHVESTWEIAYVLPSFQHYGGFERIKPIQHSVGHVLRERTSMGWDPSFQSGAKIFGPSYANVETIDVMGARYGRYEDGQGMYYETVIFTALVRERVMPPVAGTYDNLSDVEVNIDNVATGEATFANIVQTRTDTDP
jgi:hypothetical protein